MANTEPTSRRPDQRRGLVKFALLTPLILALTGCEESRFGLPKPATEQGDSVLRLWQLCMYVAIALGIVVLGVLFYSIISHRRRNDDLPKQTEGNVALEVTYTVIPFILVAALFGFGLKSQNEQTKISSNPDVTIDVVGYQWNWQFNYPSDNVSVIGGRQVASDNNDNLPTMVLPVDQRVRFNLTAADVAHSFFIPGFLTKRDVIPGVRNVIEVTPTRTDTFVGHCAEYCGVNHSQMNFRVRVVSQAEYKSWLQEQRQAEQQMNETQQKGA